MSLPTAAGPLPSPPHPLRRPSFPSARPTAHLTREEYELHPWCVLLDFFFLFFFCELRFRGVEESTRCTDRGWLSCLQDDVHCTCLSFTRNLMKDFPSRTTTLSKLPLIWCYSVLPSRQNCVRKNTVWHRACQYLSLNEIQEAYFPQRQRFLAVSNYSLLTCSVYS